MGDNFLQDSNGLFQEITRKFGVIGERTQGINRGIDQVNQQVRAGLLDLQALRQRVQTIVDRIRGLRGLPREEKQRIMDMLAALNQQADQILGQVRDLPEDVQNLPREIQIQVQAINDALDEIEGAVTDVESGRGGGGGGNGGGGGGGGGGGRAPLPPPPPPALRQGDLGGVDKRGNPNPFVLSEQGRRAAALDRGQAAASQQDAALLERLPGIENIPGPRQGGGKKRRKTKRKGRKGRKARKSRRGGYVIPKRRTHSAKSKKDTPAAGKRKSKKSRK